MAGGEGIEIYRFIVLRYTPFVMSPHPVTLARIAEESGYSRSTVGHVLNGRGVELGIRQETQEKILGIARALRYSPNPLASGLRGAKTHAVGILWSLRGPHQNETILRPLMRMVSRLNKISFILDHTFDSDSSPNGFAGILRNLHARGADGVIIQILDEHLLDDPTLSALIRLFAVRVLVPGGPVEFPADVVISDRLDALRDGVSHLLRSGRRRLVYVIEGPHENRRKIAALRSVVEAFGDGAVLNILDLRDIPPEGCLAALEADPHARAADGMLFISDEYAAAGMHWLEQTGRRCPEDVAVIGFNDSTLAKWMRPPLATVDRADLALVAQIEALVARRMADPSAPYETRTVPMRFVPRESAG